MAKIEHGKAVPEHPGLQSIRSMLGDLADEQKITQNLEYPEAVSWEWNVHNKVVSISTTFSNIVIHGCHLGEGFKCTVRYCPEDDYAAVSFSSTSGGIRSMIHPHIDRGKACFGGHSSTVSMALHELDVPLIFDLSHAMLESYNYWSCYNSIGVVADVIVDCAGCGNKEYLAYVCDVCGAQVAVCCAKKCAMCERPVVVCHTVADNMGPVQRIRTRKFLHAACYEEWLQMERIAKERRDAESRAM